MRRLGILFLLVLLVVLLVTHEALAQGRDPFRPPAGAGSVAEQGDAGPPAPEAGAPPASGGLPRTGLDLQLPVVTAAILLALGEALRLASRWGLT